MRKLKYIHEGKPLSHLGIEDMRSKEITKIIKDFYVENELWDDDKMPPIECQFRLVLKHFDIVQFLRMLILCGEGGIYWHHNFSQRLIVLAFSSKKELEISISALEEQMKKQNLPYNFK